MADNADDNVDLSENISDERRHKREKSMSLERNSRKKSRKISSTSSHDSSSPSSRSDEEQRSKKSKKKHKKRKSKKRRRTKSPTLETSGFPVVNQEDQFKWEFSDAMAEYANEHLKIFIQEKDLKDSILKTIPVPSNLQEVRQMDEFMAQLLKENRQKILLHHDVIYEKIQRKNMDVMGPLYKQLWESLETANKEQESSVSISNLIKFVTQSIIHVGRTNIDQSYHRCLSTLDVVMKSTIQAKSKKIKTFLAKSFVSRYQKQ